MAEAEPEAVPVAEPVEEALVVRPVWVEVLVPVEVPVEVEPVAVREEISVMFLPWVGSPVVREPEVKFPVKEGLMIDTSGVEVPVVEASVSVVWAPVEVEAVEVVPVETTEVEAEEEAVEDVPVVVALEELLDSVTSNFSDCARMPVFLASVERRLIWKPEL